MARKYVINGSGSNEYATAPHILGFTGAATVRPMLYDLIIGSSATPADNTCSYHVARASSAGSGGTAPTPNPLDPNDPTSLCAGIADATTAPTKGVILLSVSLNQRATFRWVAAPGGELKVPATASNGLHIYSAATPLSAAFVVETTIYFEE